jgi:tetratricopeptide (TPR) repeat protein
VLKRLLAVLLAIGLAANATAQTAVADPEVRRGIALVDEGEYDEAILALDGAVRRLAALSGHSTNDLAEAYFYLGVAYLGKGHETSAKARFREAVQQARDMSPSPEKFPPRVIELFEKAREESRAEAPAAASAAAPVAKKKGGGKGLLIGGGLVLVGGGVALAAGGGGGGATTDPPSTGAAQTLTDRGTVADQQQQFFQFTASRAGTVEITINWSDRNVALTADCADKNPPYAQCAGTFNRTTDTSGRFTAPVTQKEYLVIVSNYSGRAGAEDFAITIRYP